MTAVVAGVPRGYEHGDVLGRVERAEGGVGELAAPQRVALLQRQVTDVVHLERAVDDGRVVRGLDHH
jgi:hypothetical protein